MTHVSAAGVDALRRSLGLDAVDTSEETIARYGRNYCRVGIDARRVSCTRPRPQTCGRLFASRTSTVTLYSFALARTGGTASGAPSGPDVIVDVGARMKRILEIDERLCFAAIEPGVTYQQMYDELGRRGHVLMMDTTSGPPEGGVVRNTLDKSAAYTPYSHHFAIS